MNLEPTLRAYIVRECRTVADRIDGVEARAQKNYFYSAFYGAMQHALNIEFSRELAHLFVVANWSYANIQVRIADESQQQMSPEAWDALARAVRTVGERIEADEQYGELLDEIAMLGYASTGNGHYLATTERLH